MAKRRMLGRVILLTSTSLVVVAGVGTQPANASCLDDYRAGIAGSGATTLPQPQYVDAGKPSDYVDVQHLNVYGSAILGLGLAVVGVAESYALDATWNEANASNAVLSSSVGFATCVAG